MVTSIKKYSKQNPVYVQSTPTTEHEDNNDQILDAGMEAQLNVSPINVNEQNLDQGFEENDQRLE